MIVQDGAVVGWRRCVVVSGIRRMNEVNPRRSQLLLGWVTVFVRVYRVGQKTGPQAHDHNFVKS